MAEVLLGQSYFLRFDPKLWEAMQPYPPLGTMYASSFLRERGVSVALFDAMLAESTGQWDRALREFQPRFAVLFEDSFNYLSKMCLLRMREAAFEMIGMAKRRGCVVLVSGSDATDHLDEYFAAGADWVLIGEAEATLAELVESLSGRSETPPRQVPGVAWPGGRAPGRGLLRDLDPLPFPAWDLVDVDRYRTVWTQRHGRFSVNMVTTRGCPYHCNWCAKPIYGQSYHCRSPRNVVDELAWLKETVRPDHVAFCDDIFGLKPKWIPEFSRLVRERRLVTPFKCLMRADLVDEETARLLRLAGCETVWMGAESGSQKILDAMDKGATVEDTREATRHLRQAGIEVGFFLQFGYPGEGWPEIEETLRMVRQCMPDDIGASVAYPLPGTPFFERVKSDLRGKANWIDSDDLAMLYQGPFPPDFYRRLHRALHKEFRARKAWRKVRSGDLTRLQDLIRAVSLPLDRLALRRFRWGEGPHP